MDAVIRVTGLTKQFKEVKAVDDLSFTVKRGEVYGFLGQNGAGKSTTIRMLLTLVKPTKGVIEIFGKELKSEMISILKQTGAVIEKPDLYKYLTALENLSIFARLSRKKFTKTELIKQLEKVGLADRAQSKVKTYSQGMKQRLGIAVALVNDPELIILDEPTNGLDPQGIADIRNLIIHLSRDLGKTIFVSSHLLTEIEQISDRLLIIDKGKKVVEGSLKELIDPEKTMLELEVEEPGLALAELKDLQWIRQPRLHNNKLGMVLHQQEIPALVQMLVEKGFKVHSVTSKHSLEDYFLSLTSGSHVDIAAN